MQKTSLIIWLLLASLVMIIFSPNQTEGLSKREQLLLYKKLAAYLLLRRHQGRNYVFPVPLPLPLPIPIYRHLQPIVYRERVPVPMIRSVPEPVYIHSYSEPVVNQERIVHHESLALHALPEPEPQVLAHALHHDVLHEPLY